MKIYNVLPRLVDCLKKWPKIPSEAEFKREYLEPLDPLLAPMLEDFSNFRGVSFYEHLQTLSWDSYRAKAITVDVRAEERRVLQQIENVEKLLGLKLQGEVVLFGSFCLMDGYARFDRGTHRVYLGVEEEHGPGPYLDILISHELTHVARESQASVWEGFGLDPKMTHDDLVNDMPVVEHLMSEGFSCVVSEIINPGHPPWAFTYQTEESYREILANSAAIDRAIHDELRDPRGHYRNLYGVEPRFSHYVWAWKWARHVLEQLSGGDPRKLLGHCTKDLLADALQFRLT